MKVDDIRKKILSEPVRDLEVESVRSFSELMKAFVECGGFMASHLGTAFEILKEIVEQKVPTIVSFTANLVATGVRGALAYLIRKLPTVAVVTTAGTLDHDIARSFGGVYYCGSFDYDDEFLSKIDIFRLGNVLVPKESYGPIIEKVVHRALKRLLDAGKERVGVYEIIEEVAKDITDPHSIIKAAAEKGAKVIVPGFVDGAFGTAIYTFINMQRARVGGKKMVVDVLIDEGVMDDIVHSCNKLAALIVGGGISKHHVIWWAQFREGLDYAIYVTTAVEYDGSLSGARPREAVSWGKIKPGAKKVVVYCDATIALPLLALALRDVS